MKRFAWLAALAGLLLVPSLAQAQVANGQVRWVWENARWITSSTSFADLVGDSLVACGATAARLDTTVAINISEWVPYPRHPAGAVDSVLFAEIRVIGDGSSFGLTDAFDSLYVSIQVSDDGTNWGLATPISGGVIGFNTTTNRGGYILDGFPANHFRINIKTPYATGTQSFVTAVSGALPNWQQLFGWQYIRIIVQAGTNTGCYKMRLGHWTVKN